MLRRRQAASEVERIGLPLRRQQAEYPGDRFFEDVPALQEAEIRLPSG